MSHKRLSDFVYRHFIEQVKDYAIYMLNPDGTVASWNEGAHRAKGYSSDEIVGQHYGIFYSEQDRNAGLPLRNLQLALDHGQYEGEGWRYRKDGSRFWAHVVVDPIYDDEGIHLGFAKITRDISEQKEINDKISWMARYDALTGLPNRVEFSRLLNSCLITASISVLSFALSTLINSKILMILRVTMSATNYCSALQHKHSKYWVKMKWLPALGAMNSSL